MHFQMGFLRKLRGIWHFQLEILKKFVKMQRMSISFGNISLLRFDEIFTLWQKRKGGNSNWRSKIRQNTTGCHFHLLTFRSCILTRFLQFGKMLIKSSGFSAFFLAHVH